jgi:hypothetical protein
MDKITYDNPPLRFRETSTNLQRAADVLAAAESVRNFWPMTARSIYYRLISSPAFKESHWLCRKGKSKGQPLKNPYGDALIPILKFLRLASQLPMWAVNDNDRIVTNKVGTEDLTGFIHDSAKYIFPTYIQCTASNQERYIEVWTEKNGLVHILREVADKFCRRVVSCKGFQSLPMYRDYVERAMAAAEQGQIPTILYCGDYDPAGLETPKVIYATLKYEHDTVIDMYRFSLTDDHLNVLEHVELKKSDKRVKKYIEETGRTVGWELDAMPPEQLQDELERVLTGMTISAIIGHENNHGVIIFTRLF